MTALFFPATASPRQGGVQNVPCTRTRSSHNFLRCVSAFMPNKLGDLQMQGCKNCQMTQWKLYTMSPDVPTAGPPREDREGSACGWTRNTMGDFCAVWGAAQLSRWKKVNRSFEQMVVDSTCFNHFRLTCFLYSVCFPMFPINRHERFPNFLNSKIL